MTINASDKSKAVDIIGIWEALYNRVMASETAFENQIHVYTSFNNYVARMFNSSIFAQMYKNPDGSVREYAMINNIYKNLDLNKPSVKYVQFLANKYDGVQLLQVVLARPLVMNKLEKLATPFVDNVIEGKPVTYGVSVSNQPENSPPTGINMDMLPDIPETTPAGTTVGTLQAVDPDEGDTHTFELTNADGSVPFSIDGDKIIYDGTDVDGDTDYVLNVKVTDSAGNVSETSYPVAVTVTDEDELAPIPTVPGQVVMGDDEDNLFTAIVTDVSNGTNTLTGAFVDGKGGTDTLKVIVDLSDDLDGNTDLYVDDSKFIDFKADYVGAFHTENVEVFELKQFGDDERQLAVDLGGMGDDLERIVSDSAQTKVIAFTNVATADGLELDIRHTQAWHVVDFKKGLTTGEETVTIGVEHVGAAREEIFDAKHDLEDKRDPGKKGIKIALTEAATTKEHGKLADIKEVAFEFNGDQPNVIRALEAGYTLDTISGSGEADTVLGSFEHSLFYTNPYLQTVDMSGTSGDNSYVVTWGGKDLRGLFDSEWSDDSFFFEHSIWKVPVYDDHGHAIGHEELTFNGGSGDENLYLGNGAVGLTADGGAGEDTVIFSSLPVGQDNEFTNFELAKIFSPVGSRAMFKGDPNTKGIFSVPAVAESFDFDNDWVDILDANAIKGSIT